MATMLRDFIKTIISTVRAAELNNVFQRSELSKIGLFYGAAGVAYFLLEASRIMRDPELLRDADRFCSFAEAKPNGPLPNQHSKALAKPLLNVERAIITGSGGVGYTRALLAASMGVPDGVGSGIEMLADAWSGTDALGDDMHVELHFGAAGFTCAATDLLERLTELAPAQRDVLALVQKQSAMRLVASLERPFAERADAVGMAHGVAGPLYACLRASAAPEIVSRRMDEFLDLAIDQPPLIQWPSALDTRQLDDLPTSFCGGLSGVLTLLCTAAKTLRSERIAEYAARAAFMLRKLPAYHPGICCGAAGQAIAVSHHAAISGCSASARWARSRLRWAAEESASQSPVNLWYGRPGIALAAFALSGKGALPLFPRP